MKTKKSGTGKERARYADEVRVAGKKNMKEETSCYEEEVRADGECCMQCCCCCC